MTLTKMTFFIYFLFFHLSNIKILKLFPIYFLSLSLSLPLLMTCAQAPMTCYQLFLHRALLPTDLMSIFNFFED
jgi:hypothetical protein